MATVAELERAIDAMLDHPLGVQQYQLARTVEGKVYEAYVFTLCLRACVNHFRTLLQMLWRRGSGCPIFLHSSPCARK